MVSTSVRSSRDKRRVPRIENLDYASRCRFGERDEVTSMRLRDLAVDSMRLDIHDADPPALQPTDVTFLEASVPQMGLYLHCRAEVARTDGEGVALRLMDLDPATRGIIRSLYPADTEWPQTTS